jgi:phenylacetic acid degradation operon negative regulatory protein
MWTMVAFTVPEDQRRLRPMLRGRLQSLGFAPLYDGLWVSPHAPDKEPRHRPGDRPCQVVHGDPGDRNWTTPSACGCRRHGTSPSSATRTTSSSGRSGRCCDASSTVRSVPPRRSVSRTRATYRWFVFAVTDPDLPQTLLPNRWPRAAAHDLFVALVDGLANLAVERVRDIVSKYDAELGNLVQLRPPDQTP